MSKANFQPLSSYIEYPIEEMQQRAACKECRNAGLCGAGKTVQREIIEECCSPQVRQVQQTCSPGISSL
jgi:hypothetical protein